MERQSGTVSLCCSQSFGPAKGLLPEPNPLTWKGTSWMPHCLHVGALCTAPNGQPNQAKHGFGGYVHPTRWWYPWAVGLGLLALAVTLSLVLGRSAAILQGLFTAHVLGSWANLVEEASCLSVGLLRDLHPPWKTFSLEKTALTGSTAILSFPNDAVSLRMCWVSEVQGSEGSCLFTPSVEGAPRYTSATTENGRAHVSSSSPLA